jgi:hypothetical protein
VYRQRRNCAASAKRVSERVPWFKYLKTNGKALHRGAEFVSLSTNKYGAFGLPAPLVWDGEGPLGHAHYFYEEKTG